LILAGGGPGTGLDHLAGLTEYERSGRIDHPTTDRVTALVVELGNPHRRYPVIHVTGTNGSGSTAAMTAALLSAAGLVVGAYTNPHLVDVAERVLVDGSRSACSVAGTPRTSSTAPSPSCDRLIVEFRGELDVAAIGRVHGLPVGGGRAASARAS
jgi:hypothetical protein